MKAVRIIFCIVACLLVAAGIPVAVLFGWAWFFVFAAGAAVAAGIMLFAKKRSDPPAPPQPDFMNTDEENERINRENK